MPDNRKLGRIIPDKTATAHGVTALTFGEHTISVADIGPHFDAALRAVQLPQSVDYSPKGQPGLSHIYKNDSLGTCVIAASAHAEDLESGNELGTVPIASDTEIVNDYVSWCGPHDQGCVIPFVLSYSKTIGQTIGGAKRKIYDFCRVNVTDATLIKACIYEFGSVTIGMALPQTWLNNSAASGFVWGIPPANDKVAGGHCVLCVGYDATTVIVATWGLIGRITWPAFLSGMIEGVRIVDEAYCRLGKDWTAINDKSPSGFNTATLEAALQASANGPNPTPPPPGPIPTPPPPPAPPVPLKPGTYQVAAGHRASINVPGTIVTVR